jgi:hypothetical protein
MSNSTPNKRKSLGLTITDLFGNSSESIKTSPRKSNEIKRIDSEDTFKKDKQDKRKSGLKEYFKKNSSMPNFPEEKKEKLSLNQKEIEKREELKTVVTPSKRKEVSGTILIQKIESKEEQDEFNDLKDLLN